MTIPFLHLFKRSAVKPAPKAAAPAPAPIEKPSSERLRKTVLPNATRFGSAQDPVQPAPQSAVQENGAAHLPPAVALALEPKIERVISLQLSEVADQMPANWIRPVSEAEGSRRILLKAAEVEKGMSG